MTDPIADMIIRIKNAFMAGRTDLVIPHSKMKEAIAKLLKASNYIEDFAVEDKKPQADITIVLRYIDKMSVITGVKRVSKPGRRIYAKAGQVPSTLNGYGMTILSTNKGVIDDKTARKTQVGGEVLCQIW